MTTRSRRPAVVLALVAVLFLSAGAFLVLRVRGACTDLVVWTSDEKVRELELLAKLHRESGRTVEGRCVTFRFSISGSRATADLLAQDPTTPWDEEFKPDIWTPSSSVWMERLRTSIAEHAGRVRSVGVTPSLATTPVVIAMPQPMAAALGWPDSAIGWGDLIALARDPAGWAAKGHPEWGRFTLGKTNPAESTTGLLSTIATVTALSRTDGELTVGDLPHVAADMTALESATVHYGRYMETFVDNLYQADAEGNGLSYVSAIAMEEKVLLDYNRGVLVGNPPRNVSPPRQKLAAIFPSDGTMFSDDPALVLDAAWVTDERRRAAEDFVQFAREHPQVFLDAGFRDGEYNPGPVHQIAAGTVPNPSYRLVRTPSTAVVDGVRELWRQTRRRANVLLVLDVSLSMADEVRPNETRLALAQSAANVIPSQLAGDDQLGLWEFSSEIGSDPRPWRELVPMGPVASVAEAFRAKASATRPLGRTALYATTRDAVEVLASSLDSSRINAVILLSDGRNEYDRDNDLARLLRDLRPPDKDRQVRVFTIAYGGDADAEALADISRASRARPYDATNAARIEDVMLDVLSNF